MAGLTKVSMFFVQRAEKIGEGSITSTVDTKGWTETYFVDGDKVDDVPTIDNVKELVKARCKLLSYQAAATGFRMQAVDPIGKSRSFDYPVPGVYDAECDSAAQCLLIPARGSGSANFRTLTLRGTPDNRMRRGVYVAEREFDRALVLFCALLKTLGFGMRGVDKSGLVARIDNISAGAHIFTKDAIALAERAEVQILRANAVGDRQKGLRTQINTVVTAGKEFVLDSWPYGACKGGRLRQVKPPKWVGFDFDPAELAKPRVGKRATGNPPRKSRGRRSARHV